jgi:hypothetical protein
VAASGEREGTSWLAVQLSDYHKERRSIQLVKSEQYMNTMEHVFNSLTKCKFTFLLADTLQNSASYLHNDWLHLIPGLNEICDLLGYYAASTSNSVPTFRDNISIPSSRVKTSNWNSWPLKMGPIGCPETSVQNYHSTLCNIPEEVALSDWLVWSSHLLPPSESWLIDSATAQRDQEKKGQAHSLLSFYFISKFYEVGNMQEIKSNIQSLAWM